METKVKMTKLVAEPDKPEIVITRTFDAPAALLYRAFTEPDLVAQWLGPRRYSVDVEKLDVKFGGTYRFINRADGEEYAFRGVFHAVEPTRIVRTFEWEGMPGHVSLESADFVEHDGKTDVVAKSVYLSMEDRDGMMEGDMEEGVNEVYDRLAELLDRLRNR